MASSDMPPIAWSTEQKQILEASAATFLLVDAPPGTGKTAIACGRVAWLIDQGVDPSNILLLSFTRTAVAELRNRIGSLSRSVEAASALRITTLDSECWSLLYGFTDDDVTNLFGGYDVNIARITTMMRKRESELIEYFENLRHLIVDEAQDLTGSRALFVLELMKILPDGCGATVFADPAQAIYGFTVGDTGISTGNGRPEEGFLDKLRSDRSITLDTQGLTHVYRTESRNLIDLFLRVRADLLRTDVDAAERYEDVKEAIRDAADDRAEKVEEFGPDAGDDGLILYRRRVEALFASSILSNKGVRHRLRMSGLPVCIHPWVGAVLSGIPSDELDRARFNEAWDAVKGTAPLRGLDRDEAWDLLRRVAGDGRGGVRGKRLRAVLSRSRPPAELCRPELGETGPIVGTIHASKGREALDVYLMIPGFELSEDRMDYAEESRVLFVGATRARRRLFVGKGPALKGARNLQPSGRACRCTWSKGRVSAQVEFGRDGDVVTNWGVSTESLSWEQARRIQRRLLEIAGEDVRLTAQLHDPGYQYLFREEDSDLPLGRFGGTLQKDIFDVGKVCGELARRRQIPRFTAKHLWCIGVRTAVLPPDHPEVQRLHRPYGESGIFLVPVVKAFTKIHLNNG